MNHLKLVMYQIQTVADKKGRHEWYKYVYDEFCGCVLCPEYKVLNYSITNREGYREFWQEYVNKAEDIRNTEEYCELYKKRQKIERVFTGAKENHGMRYTQYRGFTRVTNFVKLKFAAMNLKKLAKYKWKDAHPTVSKPISGETHKICLFFFPV